MREAGAEKILVPGAAGVIETLAEFPGVPPRGIALIAHPHPEGGGANTNKVAHTLAKTFLQLGYIALRPNFRGVGESEGEHDEGRGETDDLLTVLDVTPALLHASFSVDSTLPVALAGFSFGAYCQTHVARRLRLMGKPAKGLVLVGTATGGVEGGGQGRERFYEAAEVPADTLVIHGAEDTTVPLANVLDWAKPQNLPVVVIPGADHFFHRRLDVIRDVVLRAWHHD